MRYLAVSALMLACSAAPVAAAEYVITYTGHVVSGSDDTGAFGLGTDLSGAAYTSVYTLTDPTLSPLYSNDGTTAVGNGGSSIGFPFSLSATFTINGITKAIDGSYLAFALQRNGLPSPGSNDQVYRLSEDFEDDGISFQKDYSAENSILSTIHDFVPGADLTSPLTYTVQAGDQASGSFNFFETNYATGDIFLNVVGQLAPDSVTITGPDAAVPEPGTWTLMVCGMGLVGTAMRRGRGKVCYA